MTMSQLQSPQRILIAAVPRSGGTWLFNAARLLLETAADSLHAAWCEDYNPMHPAHHHLVKAHLPEQIDFTPAKILTTQRDLAERLASLIRMGWLEDTPDKIISAANGQERLYEYWRTRSDLEVSYQAIVEAPDKTVSMIGKAICAPVDPARARLIAEELKRLPAPEVGTYNAVTLLHPGHKAGSQISVAPVENIRRLLQTRR